MSYTSVVLEDSPRLLYLLDETSGTSAADSSGNSLTGTYKNSPTLAVAGGLTVGTAVEFNGTNQFIERAHNATLNVGDVFTYEAWIKRKENSRQDVILYKESATNKSAKLAITTGNKVQLRIPGVKTIVESTNEVKADGLWHHIVVTKNGATVKVYVDNVDVTGSVTNETCNNNEGVLTIASETTTEEFLNGSLDAVAIYATALSAARVEAHYLAAQESLHRMTLLGVGQ